MRCPKCSCEVGNQSVCPFCGATVYVGHTTWSVNNYARQNTIPVRGGRTYPAESRETENRLRSLETKVNLLIVLQAGCFVLSLLSLLIIALR